MPPAPDVSAPIRPHVATVQRFIDRLNAAITQSPLLRVATRAGAKVVDVARFGRIGPGVPGAVLEAALGGRGASLEFEVRRLIEVDEEPDGSAPESPSERRLREQRSLLKQVGTIRRAAELARRETGVHALWLGYPLVYVPSGPGADDPFILAPVCIIPMEITPDPHEDGVVRIARHRGIPPRFNTAMAEWMQRRLGVKPEPPSRQDLMDLDAAGLAEIIDAVARTLRILPPAGPTGSPRAFPSAAELDPRAGSRFFEAAALGIFRWQNESILSDLDAIKGEASCPEPVRSFLEGSAARPATSDAAPAEAQRALVTDADHSQQRAIWMAREAPGLVVHGPPGTGKSQTIVNIIADTLARGQTVLMVCQKEAATSVVMNRLRQAGLEGLCTELHDAEADRMGIFQAIRAQAGAVRDAAPTRDDGRRGKAAREIERTELELDAFARATHETHPRLGLSHRDALALEGRHFAAFPGVRPLAELTALAPEARAESLPEMLASIERTGELFHAGGLPGNPWAERTYGPALSPSAEADLQSLLATLERCEREHVASFGAEGPGLALPSDLARFRAEAEPLCAAVMEAGRLPHAERVLLAAWLGLLARGGPDRERAVVAAEAGVAHADGADRAPPDRDWEATLAPLGDAERRTALAAARTVMDYEGSFFRHFAGDARRAARLLRSVRPDAMGSLVGEIAQRGVAHAEAVAQRRRLAEAMVPLRTALGLAPGGSGAASPSVAEESALARAAARTLATATVMIAAGGGSAWARALVEPLRTAEGIADGSIEAEVRRAVARSRAAEPLLAALDGLGRHLKPARIEPLREAVRAGRPIAGELAAVRVGLATLPVLRRFEAALGSATGVEAEALAILVSYERRRAAGERLPTPPEGADAPGMGRWWGALAGYAIASAWREEIAAGHPVLARVGPEEHPKLVEALTGALKAKRAAESPAIARTWAGRQAEAAAAVSWDAVLRLRGSKNGPAPKLREAVRDTVRLGLLDLRPCWLTNPSAAAQVFPLTAGLFDLVIFDEASQCPLEQAVPVLWRGGRAVISGDPKQLPPTGFFTPGGGDGEEEEDADAAEESEDAPVGAVTRRLTAQNAAEATDLLEAAIPLLPEGHLRVHYRSEHPDLIEFSNRAFYEGRLESPPSRHPAGVSPPIRYIEVGGTYVGGTRRTNEAEAREVVRLIGEHLEGDGTGRIDTLGVVTFNRPQCDLILDLLEDKGRDDAAFRTRLEEQTSRREDGQDVGLFVKNLENVQGDERDVMLFSTTFGRKEDGSFTRYFGPLGQVGGERRLNVAVTRAKKRIVLVGSMPIEEVDTALGAGAAPGTRLRERSYLQLYLAYARAVSEGDRKGVERVLHLLRPRAKAVVGGVLESPLEEEVRDALAALGHTVHAQVGESGFAIDLAVLHPDPALGYALAVECDGAAYHADRPARIRDAWREDILRRRGWRITRVWSTTWWRDRRGETARLAGEIDAAIRERTRVAPTAARAPRQVPTPAAAVPREVVGSSVPAPSAPASRGDHAPFTVDDLPIERPPRPRAAEVPVSADVRPYPLLFHPVLMPKVWGGDRLTRFRKAVRVGDRVGECWEVADMPSTSASGAGGEPVRSVIANGPLAGRTLHEALAAWGVRLMGTARATPGGDFPLLVKFLDARENLSVQVHPSPAYATANPGAHLKTECWYILDAKPGAVIYKGFKPGVTRAMLAEAITLAGRLARFDAPGRTHPVVDLLASVPAIRGEMHDLPSGTVHALGAGVMVAEVQMASDTTFRLYDWGRVGRALHIEESLACVDEAPPPPASRLAAGERMARLVTTERFTVDAARAEAGDTILLGPGEGDAGGPAIIMLLDGSAEVRRDGEETVALETGSTVLVPAAVTSASTLHALGACSLLCARLR